MSDSPSLAWAEPPDEPEPPSLADWLKRNNAPKCCGCGGNTVSSGNQCGDEAEFLCVATWQDDGPCCETWVSIRPLSLAEREEPPVPAPAEGWEPPQRPWRTGLPAETIHTAPEERER